MRLLLLVLLLAATPVLAASNLPPLITPEQKSSWVANQAVVAVSITPANGVSFSPTRGLFVAGNVSGNACNLSMKLNLDASPQLWSNIPAGTFLPVSVIDIESTNTTCTGILALY